jgi:flavin-dependent dehydrogenase
MVRRDEFDAWLAGKARARGIAIQEGVTVLSVTPGPDGVTVVTDRGEMRARVVVGADGSNGIVRRSILPDSAVRTARLLEVLTPPPDGSSGHKPGEAYFEFACIPGGIAGYTWDFPTQLKGRPMQCWGIYDTNLLADGSRLPLRDVLAAEMARAGYRLDDFELKGHPIRWFDPFNRFAVPGVLLVGDAAGADAILGEGISIALGYGSLAARAIQSAFARGEFSFRDYRPRLRRSPLGRALTARTGLAVLYYHLHWRWFQRLLWHRLGWLVTGVAWLFVINWAKRSR